MSRDASGIEWTPALALFVQTYVLNGGDADRARAEAGLPEGFKTDLFLAEEEVKDRLVSLRENAVKVAMENADTIMARTINWANADIADYIKTGATADPDVMNPSTFELRDLTKMPKHMRQRVKTVVPKPIVYKGEVVTHAWDFALHDPVRANIELARLKKIGEQVDFSVEERGRQLYEFVRELEEIHNVRDGEFPPDDQ